MQEQNINPVEIKRYPASMTGKKLRKKLGIVERVYSSPFRVAMKFRSVAPQDRLRFLQAAEAEDYGIRLSFAEMNQMRRGFDHQKVNQFGLSKYTLCWCCQNAIAVIRHHVQPISKGGRNKVNNIIPLCNGCHGAIHPHMRTGAQSEETEVSA